jgi:hypothetical protein
VWCGGRSGKKQQEKLKNKMQQALLVGACLVVWWVVGVPLLPLILAFLIPAFAALSFILDKYNQCAPFLVLLRALNLIDCTSTVVLSSTDRLAVLVTGTSSGIGKAAALRLASSGFHVFAYVPPPQTATPTHRLHHGSSCVRKERDATSLQSVAEELGCHERLTTVLMEVPFIHTQQRQRSSSCSRR